MRNPVGLIFIVLLSVTLLACTPKPISQVAPAVTETLLPLQDESPNSTQNPTAEPTLTEESIPSATPLVIPTATNTAEPSATIMFEPIALLQGTFYGVDENHIGSGNAVIVQIEKAEYSLHLENFNVTDGPGLHVILAEDNNPYNIATLGDYLDLGELQSTKGDQTYTISTGVDLAKYGSVVIYCVPFQAIFAIASLK
jgi:hypothetical protein